MLLILAVVIISAVNGDGIISYAKNAKNLYATESEKENALLQNYLKQLHKEIKGEDETKKKELTTQQAVKEGLKVGDYISYPVQYTNVGTWVNKSTGEIKGCYPADSYVGWRVLSIEGEGTNSYIRLVSAGVPLNYYHDTKSTTTITNLTTSFFNTPINSTVTKYNFYSCGFKDASGKAVTTINEVKTLFSNKYTQMEETNPKVQSIAKEDIDAVWGSIIEDGETVTSNDLIAIPCKEPEDSEYAMIWLASTRDDGGVWCVRDIVDGDGINVLRYTYYSFSKNGC